MYMYIYIVVSKVIVKKCIVCRGTCKPLQLHVHCTFHSKAKLLQKNANGKVYTVHTCIYGTSDCGDHQYYFLHCVVLL